MEFWVSLDGPMMGLFKGSLKGDWIVSGRRHSHELRTTLAQHARSRHSHITNVNAGRRVGQCKYALDFYIVRQSR